MTTHRQIMELSLPDPASAHVPALDGVRALAILLVAGAVKMRANLPPWAERRQGLGGGPHRTSGPPQ